MKMYDDVNLSLIPADAPAVAGYVNGRWPTFPEVVRRWPRAKHLSIAVTANADAECLDVERGDATNAQAPAWVKRQMARGVRKPVVYTSVSNARALITALASAGIARSRYRLWTAHYTGRAHLCGPRCGFGNLYADATQWTDKSHGRSLDESLCADGFFGEAPKPAPKPVPPAPAPKPAPAKAPAELGANDKVSWLRIEDKDGGVSYEPLTKANVLRRVVKDFLAGRKYRRVTLNRGL